MIRRIACSLMLVCLFIAIPLSIMGFEKVELGAPFLSLMRTASLQCETYKVQIPDIPAIPVFVNPQGFELVLNFLIKVVNGLSTLINVIISILNVLINVLELIFFILKDLIQFKDDIASINAIA